MIKQHINLSSIESAKRVVKVNVNGRTLQKQHSKLKVLPPLSKDHIAKRISSCLDNHF